MLVLEPLVRFMRRSAASGDLSPAASSMLSRLSREGPQRLTELARAEGVSQPGMTQLVTRMERDSLVRRTASAGDRRGVVVEATGEGLELFERRRFERAQALQHMIDQLDPADQAALAAALPALTRLVNAGE